MIEGGNHVGFNDVGSIASAAGVGLGLDNPSIISNADQRLIARRYETAWLGFHLKGQTDLRPFIDGPLILEDLADGLLREARTEL